MDEQVDNVGEVSEKAFILTEIQKRLHQEGNLQRKSKGKRKNYENIE